jgi:cation diffusion facilitator CzcD-associated flavoprotein CzcO
VTPRIIAESLPRERYNRTSDIFDGEAFRGRRVGVLGAGAAAYDVAVAMLDHGATSVEMFMRRPQVPLLDIAREFETVGHLQHYPEMADATKWAFAVYVASLSQSPATHHFYKACAHPAFTLHGGAPWLGVGIESGDIVARTPKGAHRLDHVFIGAGMATDMLARPELRKIAEVAALWRDRFTPPPEDIDSPRLANPYLGPHFEFTAREPGGAPGLDRILAFNGLSMLSLGPMSSVSVSGHKYGAPRLVRGVTSRLWAEQEAHFVADLRAFQTSALVVPPRIAAMLAESTPRYGT